jgi:hypothetical protein
VSPRGVSASLLGRAKRAYLAGGSREEALHLIQRLRTRGFSVVLAYWHAEDDDPAEVLAEYVAAVDALRGSQESVQVAVKTPALAMDPAAVTTLAAAAAKPASGWRSMRTGGTSRTRLSGWPARPLRLALGRRSLSLPGGRAVSVTWRRPRRRDWPYGS